MSPYGKSYPWDHQRSSLTDIFTFITHNIYLLCVTVTCWSTHQPISSSSSSIQLLSSASLTVSTYSKGLNSEKWLWAGVYGIFKLGRFNTFLILFLTCPPMEEAGDTNPGIYVHNAKICVSPGEVGAYLWQLLLLLLFKDWWKVWKQLGEVIKYLKNPKL